MIPRACRFAIASLTIASFATIPSALADEPSGPPPQLSLTLKPHLDGGKVDFVAGELKLQAPRVAANGTVVRMPLVIVSIPTARYDGDALQAHDDAGPLALTQVEEPPTPTGTYRRWNTSRATSGDIVVTFKAPPRVVGPTTRTGPLFDLRSEGAGLFGAGITFLPLPDGEQPYRLHLGWDLSGMTSGARAVSSFGEGDIDTMGPASRLAFSFYAAGPLKKYPQKGDDNFALYWLTDPPFDPGKLAHAVRELHESMAKFFGDEAKPYRVFIRHNPHRDGGGTALPQSFMFGWNEATAPTLANLQSLLSHEMTHNWPAMEGEHGDTAWYSEGTAEFYSLLLSYRAGVLTTQQFLDEINERAEGYYTNPYVNSTNTEAAAQFWKDWSAQRVPYGRGFMYLALVDAKIRARSHGRRSLDDLVRPMFAREKAEKPYTIGVWLGLVSAELGSKVAREDFDAMVAGRTIVPPPTSFTPCFRLAPTKDLPYQLGFEQGSLNGDQKVIRGLVAGSAAAKAGLRDGDVVVANDDVLRVQKDDTQVMHLTVKREGADVRIEYVPRGAAVDSWHWLRVRGVSDSQCRF